MEDGAIFYNDDYQDEIEDKNKVEKEIKDISKKKGKKTCFFVNKKTFQSKANRPLVNRQGGVPKWSGHMWPSPPPWWTEWQTHKTEKQTTCAGGKDNEGNYREYSLWVTYQTFI